MRMGFPRRESGMPRRGIQGSLRLLREVAPPPPPPVHGFGPWHPVNPPALGSHDAPSKFNALLSDADTVASEMGAVSDV